MTTNRKRSALMKKSSLPVILIGCVFLVWAMSCQSPSSTGDPASSSPPAKNSQTDQSNDDSSSGSGAKTGMGFLKLTLKDAPVEDAKNVWLKISNIRVHEACDEEEGCFHTVWEDALGQDIDLLALRTFPLVFQTPLPAGTYNQIRMDIISGEIVFGPPGEPDPSDVRYPLVVPSDEVKTHLHFEVAEGEMTEITLDLDAENSIHIIKKGKKEVYQLRPVVNVVQVIEPSS
jgi:hypothetical protein